jgi:16S rRNA (guanine966-N2)-methyltransferase
VQGGGLAAAGLNQAGLRIISGKCRGRRLCTPGRVAGKAAIRPTSDRVREALYSILADRPEGARILDLFAGTGALGLEGLSRGGATAVFVDLGTEAIGLLRKNVELCGFADRSIIIKRDLTRGLSFLREFRPPEGFDLIFLDPPYRRGLVERLLAGLAEVEVLAADGLVVAEEAADVTLPGPWSGLTIADHRVYGDTGIWFYRPD